MLIDIGTDFRFRDVAVYEAWYGLRHAAPELSRRAVYGLPELFRSGSGKAASSAIRAVIRPASCSASRLW